jgi:hypothetical protein
MRSTLHEFILFVITSQVPRMGGVPTTAQKPFLGLWGCEFAAGTGRGGHFPNNPANLRRIEHESHCALNDNYIFRVHLLRDSQIFGDQLAKDLGMFIWNFEVVVDEFHPTRFLVAGQDFKDDYGTLECFERQCLHKNASIYFNYTWERSGKGNPMSPTETLQQILDCDSGSEVIELVNHSSIWGSYKYLFLSLCTRAPWHRACTA